MQPRSGEGHQGSLLVQNCCLFGEKRCCSKSAIKQCLQFFCVSHTFFCELLVYDELPMSEVVQYWTKIRGISIDEIRSCLILLSVHRNEAGTVKWHGISLLNYTLNSFSLRIWIPLLVKSVSVTLCFSQHFSQYLNSAVNAAAHNAGGCLPVSTSINKLA